MRFWKMNGAGNDFIILNNLEEHLSPEVFPDMARTLCERRMSLGADGLMVVDAPTGGKPCGGDKSGGGEPASDDSADSTARADFRMLFFNSDGTVGEMCGNGARCICRYGYETGLAGERQTVETTAGIVTGERIDRRRYRVRLNDPTLVHLEGGVEVEGVRYPCAYVELGHPGLPHAVVPYPNLREADEDRLRRLGRAIRWHKAFPKGANVNFYELIGEDTVYERTFERGVEDFTYACGTGTGSVVTVLTLRRQVSGRNVRVEMRGGTLEIDALRDGQFITDLYLTGPTNVVAKGEIFDEDLMSPKRKTC